MSDAQVFIKVASWALVIIGILVYLLRNWKFNEPNSGQLESLAQSLGLKLEKSYRSIVMESFFLLPMFNRGRDGVAFNTLSGVLTVNGRPHPIRMGQYRYTIDLSDDKESDVEFSYLLVQLPYAGVPDTLIRPEGMADKLTAELGEPDINFESAEFSRRFHVQCESKRFVYDLLNASAMEFLLRGKPRRIEIVKGHLLMGDGSTEWSIAEFKANYDVATGFLKCWPPHLADLLDSGRWLDEERS